MSLGASLVGVVWFIGFITIGLIWLVSRPKSVPGNQQRSGNPPWARSSVGLPTVAASGQKPVEAEWRMSFVTAGRCDQGAKRRS